MWTCKHVLCAMKWENSNKNYWILNLFFFDSTHFIYFWACIYIVIDMWLSLQSPLFSRALSVVSFCLRWCCLWIEPRTQVPCPSVPSVAAAYVLAPHPDSTDGAPRLHEASHRGISTAGFGPDVPDWPSAARWWPPDPSGRAPRILMAPCERTHAARFPAPPWRASPSWADLEEEKSIQHTSVLFPACYAGPLNWTLPYREST